MLIFQLRMTLSSSESVNMEVMTGGSVIRILAFGIITKPRMHRLVTQYCGFQFEDCLIFILQYKVI